MIEQHGKIGLVCIICHCHFRTSLIKGLDDFGGLRSRTASLVATAAPTSPVTSRTPSTTYFPGLTVAHVDANSASSDGCTRGLIIANCRDRSARNIGSHPGILHPCDRHRPAP